MNIVLMYLLLYHICSENMDAKKIWCLHETRYPIPQTTRTNALGKSRSSSNRAYSLSGSLEGVAIDTDAFQKAKDAYYDMTGWPRGVPSVGKLGELGIEWAFPLLLVG